MKLAAFLWHLGIAIIDRLKRCCFNAADMQYPTLCAHDRRRSRIDAHSSLHPDPSGLRPRHPLRTRHARRANRVCHNCRSHHLANVGVRCADTHSHIRDAGGEARQEQDGRMPYTIRRRDTSKAPQVRKCHACRVVVSSREKEERVGCVSLSSARVRIFRAQCTHTAAVSRKEERLASAVFRRRHRRASWAREVGKARLVARAGAHIGLLQRSAKDECQCVAQRSGWRRACTARGMME
ncbi:hypothetical protein K438DRAFT_180943 [Mycena galopus ATCC 62051]|nr:hypothetical protein K438DRAFT_180943 [Mycena galopus ATCC 62051]